MNLSNFKRAILTCLAILSGWGLWIALSSTKVDKSTAVSPQTQAKPNISPKLSPLSSKLEEEASKELIRALVKAAGFREVPPLEQELKELVASRSKDKIRLAFQEAVYSRKWLMSEVIPVLKFYLNDPDPFVRYSAAQNLYITGDISGYEVLIALVQASDQIKGDNTVDLRIQAAQVLGKFRQYDAAQVVYDFYKKNPKSGLVSSLLKLNIDVHVEVQNSNFYAEGIRGYTLAGAKKFIPQITIIFDQSPKPELKLAAAWGLSVMNEDQNAKKYLFKQAEAMLSESPPIGNASNVGCDALKYIAINQSPEVKQILEKSLESKTTYAVQIAIVNLIFNQGGSAKANQLIAQRLMTPDGELPLEFTLNIAAQILDDPAIQAAGEKYMKNDSAGFWKLHTEEQKNWSIYNWVDDYVVKLNERKP